MRRIHWATDLFTYQKSTRNQRSPFSAARSPLSRLRLVAAAKMRLPVGAALGGALGLVFLGQRLLAHLVMVVADLAGLRLLFVARVLFVGHVNFLCVGEKACGQLNPPGPAVLRYAHQPDCGKAHLKRLSDSAA